MRNSTINQFIHGKREKDEVIAGDHGVAPRNGRDCKKDYDSKIKGAVEFMGWASRDFLLGVVALAIFCHRVEQ